MTEISSLKCKTGRRRFPRWRRAYRALLTEARMVAAWLWAPVAMGLESMLRFVLRPTTTVMFRRGEPFPSIASIDEELGTISRRRKNAGRSPELFSTRAVLPNSSASRAEFAPASKPRLKTFHAARHSEE